MHKVLKTILKSSLACGCVLVVQVDMRPLRDIFMTLPSKRDYPDYYTVISEPIDLTIIEGKIKGGLVSAPNMKFQVD